MIEIEEIKRLDVRLDDTLLIRVPAGTPMETIKRISSVFKHHFPNASFIFDDIGVQVEVMREPREAGK